jgi:protein FRA10AC1
MGLNGLDVLQLSGHYSDLGDTKFALRWRTEEEVLEGAGEDACANVRCRYALPMAATAPSKRKHKKHKSGSLNTLELPFGYVEEGKQKSALVKVVLCNKCVRKIMWKREADKRRLREAESRTGDVGDHVEPPKPREADLAHSDGEGNNDEGRERRERGYRQKRSSRSRSPRRKELESNSRWRRSP